jgi:hypothetical protein
MDGGKLQRKMTEVIKDEIKQKAAYRREKANASDNQFNVISNMLFSHNISSTESTSTPEDNSKSSQGPALLTLAPESESAATHKPTPFSLLSHGHHQHHCSSCMEQSPGIETDFITKYIDFVFPALFPFYRPAFFETGRSWLLLLLGKSRIAYHSTVSLSGYFFTMALTDADSEEELSECKQSRWREVEQQTDDCFTSIRTDMLALDIKSEVELATNLEKVEIMESITQVLIFEMALGKSAPWNSHLPLAFALFEDIMACSGKPNQDQRQTKLVNVLLGIGEPIWTQPDPSSGLDSYIWSPDQAGFRFCAGLLIFIDVVASTAIQQTPRLLKYHPEILAPIDEGTSVLSDAEVRLSSIVGCRNWVITAIARISALDSWKREQIDANHLSVVELVDRASSIADDLKNGILNVQNYLITSSATFLNHRAPFYMRPSPSTTTTSTLIWAYAAQLYLKVVATGWQLSDLEVRTQVAYILELLQTVPSYQLRAVAWPLCVAGCLALESEEASFVALFSNLGKVDTAGALNDAQQMLKHVWQTREMQQVSTWNLASCFSILGSPILLV